MADQFSSPNSPVMQAMFDFANRAQQNRNILPLDDTTRYKIRGLRVVEARLGAILKLTTLLINGWRLGGENKTYYFGDKLSFIDQDTYGRLLLLERAVKDMVEDLRSTHSELINTDADIAHRVYRKSVLVLALEDEHKFRKLEVRATDEAVGMDFSDPRMRALRITMTRYVLISWLYGRLYDDDNTAYCQTLDLIINGLLPPTAKDNLKTVTDKFDACFDQIVSDNKQLRREYDKYAASKGWPPLKVDVAFGAEPVKAADWAILRECASWKVNE